VKPQLAKHTMTGADVVVGALEARGSKYVFGVPGAKIDKLFDTLVDSPIQTVVCRHEQNAAFIAGGIGTDDWQGRRSDRDLRAWSLQSGDRFGDCSFGGRPNGRARGCCLSGRSSQIFASNVYDTASIATLIRGNEAITSAFNPGWKNPNLYDDQV
jgi:hypothetical protein